MEGRRPLQNTLLWVVAVVLINALWMNVAGQSAPNEVNANEQFQTIREVEISPVFGSSSPIPATFTTSFKSTTVDQANVSFSIKKDNATAVFSWSGLLTDDVPVWDGELEPGSYTIETLVEEGVLVEQRLDLQPFAAIQGMGHLVLTLLLIALAWGEQGVRAWYARRTPTPKAPATSKVPFKSRALSNEEDPLIWEENDSPWRDPIR
ncbi:MAG: hypothetical protein VW982_01605 [Candidatus Poseidoniales archaeon]|jgi:hypothetical protein